MRRLVCLTALAIGACTSGARHADTPSADSAVVEALTPAQRQAVEDTLRKLNEFSIAAQNRRDLDALMQIMPDTGGLAVADGMMIGSSDSIRAIMHGMWSAPWLKSLHLENEIRKIDVLSPNAAVVTATSKTTVDSAGRELTFHNIWTGLWENRGGKWVIVQQHSSTVPPAS